MWFHEVVTPKTMLAGAAESELRIRFAAVAVWLAASLLFVILALVAYKMGWGDGAKSIVNIAAGMVVGGGSASILGEKRGAAAKSPRAKKAK